MTRAERHRMRLRVLVCRFATAIGAEVPPMLCPKCGVRPSRMANGYRGKVPYCTECVAERLAAHTAKWVDLRSKTRVPRASSQDLSAAEIEARYAAALTEIRARR